MGFTTMPRSMQQIEEDYKNLGVEDLRKALKDEIKKYKTEELFPDGKRIRMSHTKRKELLELISKMESLTPLSEKTTQDEPTMNQVIEEQPIVTKQPVTQDEPITEESKAITPKFKNETEYTDYEALLKRIASKYYQGFTSDDVEVLGIRQFAQSQLQRAQTNQSLMDTRLFATVAHFKEDILSVARTGSEDGKINPSSAINLRVEILNRIKKAVNAESEQFTILTEIEGMEPFSNNYLSQSYEAFRNGVIASFSTIAREKRESQGTNFLARRTSTPHCAVTGLVQWAIGRLKNLPTKAQEWREVALAIMICTGRRPAEVLGVGIFQAIDHTNIQFHGQLKKKGESDERAYKIPAIGDTAKEVEVAIQWLQMMNKRTVPASRSLEDKQHAAKQCHDRFSRYLSAIADAILPNYLVLADGASWDLDDNRSRIKPYLSRQIYLQIISKLVQISVSNGVSIDPDLAVTYYSGHYLSVDGKDANAENYLADIVINDMENVKSIWDWTPDLSIAEIESIRK